jgi:hypothetical protein
MICDLPEPVTRLQRNVPAWDGQPDSPLLYPFEAAFDEQRRMSLFVEPLPWSRTSVIMLAEPLKSGLPQTAP